MRLRRLAVAVLIAGCAAAVAYALVGLRMTGSLLNQLELQTLDYRMRAAADPARDQGRIALILFDSTSVESWPYLSPFPRSVIADLIEVASAGGADVIGVDVHLDRLYPELDVFGPGDARLREAIEKAGNVILPGATSGTAEERAFEPPHAYFASVAVGLAVADLPTPFETVRDAVLTVETDQGRLPGFALALYAASGAMDAQVITELDAGDTLPIATMPDDYAQVPDEAVQTVPILFTGPPSRSGMDDGTFLTVPAAFARFMPGMFEDRIVLIGTGFHAQDRFRSPFYEHVDSAGAMYGWINGVEVHANALQNLLAGRFLVPLGTASTILLIFSLALTVTGITFLRGATWGAIAAVSVCIGLLVVGFVAFARDGLHIPLISPTLATAFAFLGSTGYISGVEGAEKRLIRRAFAKYVAPTLVEQLMADPSRLRLGGEKRQVTLLFTDLAGFTSLSETSDPERVLSLLNRYLDQMSEILLEEGGTLDKYMGDAVMAIFGAPVDQEDHALRACSTALRMQRRLDELNEEWAIEGWTALAMRIGINTGTPIVGNIGGDKRFDYTALGDAVNLAARLEPACKRYGVPIIISESTRAAAGDEILVRELDLLAVYGKSQPVRIYELVGLQGEEMSDQLMEAFERGLTAYRARDFAAASSAFESAAFIAPEDGPTRLYLQRCNELALAPPPEGWDYVARATSK